MTQISGQKVSRRLGYFFNDGLDAIGLGVLFYAYAVLLGAAYLFAFWRVIGFDIFPYLSLQNYISAPLNRVAVLIALPILLATFLSGRKSDSNARGFFNPVSYLLLLYLLLFLPQQYESVSRYLQYEFYFLNEVTVLSIATILF